MYDIHCHIIPGVDDGAKDYYEAKKMVQRAYDEGIRGLIATPHYHSGISDAELESWQDGFKTLKKAAKSVSTGFELHQGAEVYIDSEVLEKLKSGEPITMAKSGYVLLECSYGAPYRYLERLLLDVVNSGFKPILAHMERYSALTDIESVENIRRLGVLLQVNAKSVVKGSFQRKRWILKLVQKGYIDAIGSDAHNVTTRPAHWAACMEYLQKKVGNETVERLTTDVYERIIMS